MTMKYTLLILMMTIGTGVAIASENERGEYGERYEQGDRYGDRDRDSYKRGGMMMPNNDYTKECSACHMAYPVGMLPKRSWKQMMATLDDHFGENAELSAEMNKSITDYLMANAGDAGRYESKMMRGLRNNETPLRISDLPYFKREHREVPAGALRDKRVGSISNCNACHQRAEAGSFSERDINIPGYGRWED